MQILEDKGNTAVYILYTRIRSRKTGLQLGHKKACKLD